MTNRDDVELALERFAQALSAAGSEFDLSRLQLDFQLAPHERPGSLPPGMMAVYGFFLGSVWLKIGKVGPNSSQRYSYQHYKPGSAASTLAGSLMKDDTYRTELEEIACTEHWITTNTGRMNILVPASFGAALLSFLEAFLQLRFDPIYEGHQWK